MALSETAKEMLRQLERERQEAKTRVPEDNTFNKYYPGNLPTEELEREGWTEEMKRLFSEVVKASNRFIKAQTKALEAFNKKKWAREDNLRQQRKSIDDICDQAKIDICAGDEGEDFEALKFCLKETVAKLRKVGA